MVFEFYKFELSRVNFSQGSQELFQVSENVELLGVWEIQGLQYYSTYLSEANPNEASFVSNNFYYCLESRGFKVESSLYVYRSNNSLRIEMVFASKGL